MGRPVRVGTRSERYFHENPLYLRRFSHNGMLCFHAGPEEPSIGRPALPDPHNVASFARPALPCWPWQCWPGNVSPAMPGWKGLPGNAGQAMLVWPYWSGTPDQAMLTWPAGMARPAMLVWQCWPSNAALAMLPCQSLHGTTSMKTEPYPKLLL